MIASGKDTEHLDFSYFVAVRVRCYRNTLAVSYTNMHIFSFDTTVVLLGICYKEVKACIYTLISKWKFVAGFS